MSTLWQVWALIIKNHPYFSLTKHTLPPFLYIFQPNTPPPSITLLSSSPPSLAFPAANARRRQPLPQAIIFFLFFPSSSPKPTFYLTPSRVLSPQVLHRFRRTRRRTAVWCGGKEVKLRFFWCFSSYAFFYVDFSLSFIFRPQMRVLLPLFLFVSGELGGFRRRRAPASYRRSKTSSGSLISSNSYPISFLFFAS